MFKWLKRLIAKAVADEIVIVLEKELKKAVAGEAQSEWTALSAEIRMAEKRIQYTNSEEFLDDFIKRIKKKQLK